MMDTLPAIALIVSCGVAGLLIVGFVGLVIVAMRSLRGLEPEKWE